MRIVAVLLLAPVSLLSQQLPPEELSADHPEQLLVADDDDNTDPESLENLMHYLSHPVDLNKVGEEELRNLGILTPSQLNHFFLHRKENGLLLSMSELQTIEGFDTTVIQKLSPVAYVRDPAVVINRSLAKRIQEESENYFMVRYEYTAQEKRGFTSPWYSQRFQGSPEKTAFRFRSFKAGDFSIGLNGEKDQGEKYEWKPQQNKFGMDFISFHIQLQNKGKIKNLILGDYQVQFGQGLVCGGALGFGKGAETITNVRKSNIGFVPFTSLYEAGALKGVAASVRLSDRFSASPFFSFAPRDASLAYRENTLSVSSIASTGLHRNGDEIEKRYRIRENTMGLGLHYDITGLSAGFTIQHISFSLPVYPRERIYNQFTFRGKESTNTGVYLNYNYHNLSFFGEAAKTLGNGHGYVAGLLASLSRKLDFSILLRNYAANFHSFHSNGFSESSVPQNERGFYWGWKYKFNRRFSTSGYYDLFESPWLKFRTYSPSAGNEWLLRVTWQPSKQTQLYIQGRGENKIRNNSESKSPLYQTAATAKLNFWFNADYGVSPVLRLKTRIQMSRFSSAKGTSRGFMIFQDISGVIRQFKVTGRYALFDTDDYDNRLYVYEHDVWLSWSLPAYYGQGVRKYILVQYKYGKNLTFWLRYSHTRYIDRESIGSGADTIEGNQRNDLKFETRITF